MQIKPSVRLYETISLGGRYISDITAYTSEYRHRNKMQGGYWGAEWKMVNLSSQAMIDFFNRRLSCHLEEAYQGIETWEGLIWEMELHRKGVIRRISMEDVRNKIKCVYTDVSDDQRKETGWYSNNSSIDRYGEIQEIVFLNKTTTTAAQKYAQTILAENAYPMSRPVSIRKPKPDEKTQLFVTAVGYAYTMNYQYISIGDTTDTISNHVASVISTNCPFVKVGKIRSNSIQVAPPDTETRAWDWLMEITEIGDGVYPYRLAVWNNRRFYYNLIDPTPHIIWDGQAITTQTRKRQDINSWNLRPVVMKDITWHGHKLPSSYFLENTQDSVVSEIEIGEGYELPILKTDYYEDSEMLAALVRNRPEEE